MIFYQELVHACQWGLTLSINTLVLGLTERMSTNTYSLPTLMNDMLVLTKYFFMFTLYFVNDTKDKAERQNGM